MPTDRPVGLPVLLSIGYTWVLGLNMSERAGDSGGGEVPPLLLLGRWGQMTQGSPPGGPEAGVSSVGCTVYPVEFTSPPGWTTRPLSLGALRCFGEKKWVLEDHFGPELGPYTCTVGAQRLWLQLSGILSRGLCSWWGVSEGLLSHHAHPTTTRGPPSLPSPLGL